MVCPLQVGLILQPCVGVRCYLASSSSEQFLRYRRRRTCRGEIPEPHLRQTDADGAAGPPDVIPSRSPDHVGGLRSYQRVNCHSAVSVKKWNHLDHKQFSYIGFWWLIVGNTIDDRLMIYAVPCYRSFSQPWLHHGEDLDAR